ncbi:MAG TPA: prolyl oligopeptidase family serine peptidase [Methylomirabilota bacterium]|jgi:predicted peptidase|nr:prolyl oligopeptidase family serine peptidase [Methylomirabilota bacterium]
MKLTNLSLAGVALVVLTGCQAPKPNPATSKLGQMAQHFTFQKTEKMQADYLLFLPQNYRGGTAKRWPLILFLHGAGERGTDVWKVATHGPPKNVAEHPDFPFIVVSPQCPEGRHWSNDLLLALLDEISRKYAVDPERVYLTGLSMGGFGTWSLGVSHPERFAAIVPICGGGEWISVVLSSRDRIEQLKTLGVWAFHGAKDPVVPLEESQRMVDALKKVGVTEVKLTVYPEAGHNSWTETYNNPELYKWLLEHRRVAGAKR